MKRIMAGAGVTLLLTTGVFLFWQGRAQDRSALPAPPAAEAAANPRLFAATATPVMPAVPAATTKTREERRFSRADKDKDGRIESEELLAPRRKAFAKLDTDGNGTLSFSEWAVRTTTRIASADKDKSGWLTPAEYATTAPPARPQTRCSC